LFSGFESEAVLIGHGDVSRYSPRLVISHGNFDEMQGMRLMPGLRGFWKAE
jgi:hypothetical protein